jgi:hypothetical protein
MAKVAAKVRAVHFSRRQNRGILLSERSAFGQKQGRFLNVSVAELRVFLRLIPVGQEV